MKQNEINEEEIFNVILKSGDQFEAVSSFDLESIGSDGGIEIVSIFKAWDYEIQEYYLISVPRANIEYTEQGFNDDLWEQLLGLAQPEDEDDGDATEYLYG